MARAHEALAEGEQERAIRHVTRAIRAAPACGSCKELVARGLAHVGSIAEASSILVPLARIHGDQPEVLIPTSMVATRVGDPDEARRYALQGIEAGVDPYESYLYLGALSLKRGDTYSDGRPMGLSPDRVEEYRDLRRELARMRVVVAAIKLSETEARALAVDAGRVTGQPEVRVLGDVAIDTILKRPDLKRPDAAWAGMKPLGDGSDLYNQ